MTDGKKEKAAVILRDILIRDDGLTVPPAVKYRKTERALFAFLQGDPIQKLYEAEGELFPLHDETRLAAMRSKWDTTRPEVKRFREAVEPKHEASA